MKGPKIGEGKNVSGRGTRTPCLRSFGDLNSVVPYWLDRLGIDLELEKSYRELLAATGATTAE